MSTDNTHEMIATLSARVAALEMGLAALAQSPAVDRPQVLRVFDMLADELDADYVRRPIGDEHVDRLRESLADVRRTLE